MSRTIAAALLAASISGCFYGLACLASTELQKASALASMVAAVCGVISRSPRAAFFAALGWAFAGAPALLRQAPHLAVLAGAILMMSSGYQREIYRGPARRHGWLLVLVAVVFGAVEVCAGSSLAYLVTAVVLLSEATQDPWLIPLAALALVAVAAAFYPLPAEFFHLGYVILGAVPEMVRATGDDR